MPAGSKRVLDNGNCIAISNLRWAHPADLDYLWLFLQENIAGAGIASRSPAQGQVWLRSCSLPEGTCLQLMWQERVSKSAVNALLDCISWSLFKLQHDLKKFRRSHQLLHEIGWPLPLKSKLPYRILIVVAIFPLAIF